VVLVVAAGGGRVLSDPAYYVTSIKTVRTPFYLELLREIAYKHPFQVPTLLRFAMIATPGHLLTSLTPPPNPLPTFQRGSVLQVLQECFTIDYDLDALAAVRHLPSPIPSGSNSNNIRCCHSNNDFLFVGIVGSMMACLLPLVTAPTNRWSCGRSCSRTCST
jgi:hypothetical protein